MLPGYLPEKVIEYKNERIYPDHTTRIKIVSDISEVIAKCEREKGSVVEIREITYPRYKRGFEDWKGYMVGIDLASCKRIELILGPNMDSIVQDLNLQDTSELIGKKVSCYRISPEFREENEYLGISIEK